MIYIHAGDYHIQARHVMEALGLGPKEARYLADEVSARGISGTVICFGTWRDKPRQLNETLEAYRVSGRIRMFHMEDDRVGGFV